jgi:hypothetical protein
VSLEFENENCRETEFPFEPEKSTDPPARAENEHRADCPWNAEKSALAVVRRADDSERWTDPNMGIEPE